MTTYCLRLFVVLQALDVVASEVMVGDTCDTCIPSLIVINTTINQLNILIIFIAEAICCCLQTCNVAASEEIVGKRYVPSLIVINSTINKLESKVSLITTCCLRLFVVVYRVEML